ncbi:MBOAT, membrane-bound O-acyltransferase family-domain-containing protein [Sparassis latifolia]
MPRPRSLEGTLYVSKPFRSSSTNNMRAVITFTPRKSHFDTTNESSGSNEFRGFFTLFWISMFIFTVRTYIRSIETNGYALNLGFATMFSRDAITLTLSDATLVGSTFLCVPFAKAIKNGWIKYHWTGVILQHLWQCCVLAFAVTWTFNRQWPWVQSGFLTLHSLVMIMKVHSYIATNGNLTVANAEAESIYAKLHSAVAEDGGWDSALAAAEANRTKIESEGGHVGNGNSYPNGTPKVTEGSTTSYIPPDAAVALRQRITASGSRITQDSESSSRSDTPERTTQVKTAGTRVAGVSEPSDIPPTPSQILANHPSSHIAELARAHAELEAELTSSGPEHIRWPANISLRNFGVYLLIPSLVYELEYPRTDRIRPLYVFEKTVATFGSFALLYTVTESFILPLTPTPDQSFFRSLLDLALPFMIAYLLLFYLIFECICNGFAELSYFADRRFYDDWWNSTSWDEFSRKWNRPVHTFLLRHVYASTITNYQLSRTSAMFLTFLLSASAHELVMAIVTKKIRMYLFVLQIIQLPLIAIGRIPAIKRNKLLGNIVFWLGLYAGLPLLCVAYVAY